MPVMYLNTNMKDLPKGFEHELCQRVGEVLDKPIEKITLTVHTGVCQVRSGSTDPMVSLDIHSIGVFDKDRNPDYTTQLMKFLCEKLTLPEKRVLLVYHDLQLHNIGQKLS